MCKNVYTPFLLLYENKKLAILIENGTHVARGTVCTKCAYTVPVTVREQEIGHIDRKWYSCCKRNGVYKMCIHRSCYCTRTRNLPYLSKFILMLQQERCVQNVYTPFLLLYENTKFFHICLNSYSCCNRNDVYKMCIHRSCYCTRTRNLPYLSNIILMLQEEQCVQNVYVPFLLLYGKKKFDIFI